MDLPLGHRVRERRLELGLGLNEAARRCGIAPQKLADAEAGKDSRASSVAAIAIGLGVSADYLLGLPAAGSSATADVAPHAVDLVRRVAELERAIGDESMLWVTYDDGRQMQPFGPIRALVARLFTSFGPSSLTGTDRPVHPTLESLVADLEEARAGLAETNERLARAERAIATLEGARQAPSTRRRPPSSP